jgi:two-component system, sensor histidine kinase LadS
MGLANKGLVMVYRSTFTLDPWVRMLNALRPRKLLFLFALLWAQASSALQLDDGVEAVNLSANVEVLEDRSGQLTWAQVQSPEMASRFVKPESTGASLNLGFTSSTYWVRFRLSQREDSKAKWLLQVNYPALDFLAFYAPGAAPVITGRSQPIDSRPMWHRYFVFPLQLSTQEQFHYLCVASQGDMTVPIWVSSDTAFFSASQTQLALQFLYSGGLLVLCLYNVFVYYFVREKLFLLYAGYACAVGMGMLSGNGLSRLILWPDWVTFDSVAQYFFFAVAGALLVLLTRGFVSAKWNSLFAWACRVSVAFFSAIALTLLVSVWWHFDTLWVSQAMMLCSALAVVVIVLGVFLAWRSGRTGLRFFMASWLVLALGIFTASARMMGWLPTNGWTAFSLQISSVFEMFFLFLALADQWRLDRNVRVQAQINEKEIQELYTATLLMMKDNLEDTVNQRTEQLELALANERKTLAQYVRFGAMISHEFRNPLAIIKSQLSLMHKEHERGQLKLDQRLSILDNATRRLTSMFDKWLQSDKVHQTMQDIAPHRLPLVAWLKNFVHSNLYSFGGLHLELKLDPLVTHVVVDEYLLEIVLSNLIDNARKYAGLDARVIIETRLKPGFAGIAVIDNGPGIASKHQVQVFEEYFRVSPQSGVPGMGLGLSIVSRIAQAHGGELQLQSEAGKGCCFCIWLPTESPS